MPIMLFYILNPLVNALVATILGFVIYFRNRRELKETFAEIVGEQTKKIEKIISDKIKNK